MTDDADSRLYKIGEVCRLADVQPYVLRYWETEFPSLAPNKSGGGQRLYAQNEINVILRIKQLLYSEGFTIAGAKKKLEAELSAGPVAPTVTPSEPGRAAVPADDNAREALRNVRRELTEILKILGE